MLVDHADYFFFAHPDFQKALDPARSSAWAVGWIGKINKPAIVIGSNHDIFMMHSYRLINGLSDIRDCTCSILHENEPWKNLRSLGGVSTSAAVGRIPTATWSKAYMPGRVEKSVFQPYNLSARLRQSV